MKKVGPEATMQECIDDVVEMARWATTPERRAVLGARTIRKLCVLDEHDRDLVKELVRLHRVLQSNGIKDAGAPF